MKLFTKPIILLLITLVAASILLIYFLTPKRSQSDKKAAVYVETKNGRCKRSEKNTGKIYFDKESVLNFSGTIVNISPCDKIRAKLRQVSLGVKIILFTELSSSPCIECIGAVDFSGKVQNLPEVSDNLQLLYQSPNGEITPFDK